jgi:hypothetical protein
MKLSTNAHAARTDTHGQALAPAQLTLGEGVDRFVHAEADEVKRAAIGLRMILVKSDVIIGVDKLDVAPLFGGIGGDADRIGGTQKGAADPSAVGIREGRVIEQVKRSSEDQREHGSCQ